MKSITSLILISCLIFYIFISLYIVISAWNSTSTLSFPYKMKLVIYILLGFVQNVLNVQEYSIYKENNF